jgi:hypothetical protein
MHVHGGLTLQFDALKPYAFVSRAQWPRNDNYETSIREAVEEVPTRTSGTYKFHARRTDANRMGRNQFFQSWLSWARRGSNSRGFRCIRSEALDDLRYQPERPMALPGIPSTKQTKTPPP